MSMCQSPPPGTIESCLTHFCYATITGIARSVSSRASSDDLATAMRSHESACSMSTERSSRRTPCLSWDIPMPVRIHPNGMGSRQGFAHADMLQYQRNRSALGVSRPVADGRHDPALTSGPADGRHERVVTSRPANIWHDTLMTARIADVGHDRLLARSRLLDDACFESRRRYARCDKQTCSNNHCTDDFHAILPQD